ncbi:hypothetical protein [Portibacter marinus]|uniref:hypothetical protein n=1 Tax=Portibacter marinus TaxID=2898660 RepID=UPI001F3675CB|nr:hypothetical protein [Portibacter marinus]
MVKVFRKMRKMTSSNRRFSNYLLYGIGEILLVVVGILIALQINNWNLDRLDRIAERSILQSLQVEFTENLRDAKRVYDGNLGIMNAMSQLQDKSKALEHGEASFDMLMYAVFDWFDYNSRPGASNNLVNSGNLNLIQNEELRNKLTIWSGVDDELDDDEQLAIHFSQNTIVPFLAEHYPMSNLERFDFTLEFYREDTLEFEAYEDHIPFNRKELLNHPTLQSHISIKKMHARHNAMEGYKLLKECEKILELVTNEINRN